MVARKEGTNDITPDSQYDTATEKRIIQGEELVTAKANGELPKDHKGRKDHNSSTHIIVKSSISTEEISKKASDGYRTAIREDLERRRASWTSE